MTDKDKETKDKLADAYDSIEALLEEKNKEIEELKQEKERLKKAYEEGEEENQKALAELEEKINELFKEIEDLTKEPPIHVGKLIGPTKPGWVLILDNHRTEYEVRVSKKIKPESLEEGSEVKYVVDPMSGKPLTVFAVNKDRRSEEVVMIKDLINENLALVVLPGDVFKLANIGKKVQSKLEKGDEVYYDSVINFITEKIEKKEERVDLSRVARKSYQDIGGLEEQIRKIKEVADLPLRHPEVFEKLGINPPKGILLSGPPGCGKTLIGQVLANETQAFFIHISGPEIMSSYVGESEARLRALFDVARKNAPAIIFLDEIEAIAQKREEMHTGQLPEQRVVAQLLSSMDGLTTREKVIVIAATNVPDLLDPALRRPGRFDREIEILVPDRDGRLEILKIHSKQIPLASDVDLNDLADRTHGFTGADLEALCKEAAMRVLKDIDLDKIDSSLLEKAEVTLEFFNQVLEEMKPSIMREITLQKPTETWADVGGLDEVKQKLEEAVKWPLLYPELLKKAKQKPARGILLYGPPGCGKTLMARALANECGVNFIAIKGPELLSKWVGQSEENVRKLFKRARQSAPCVIFFDEIDALVSMRGMVAGDAGVSDKVTAQLLTELDGIEELRGVFILAATNRLDLVDPALLRPGRLKWIYLPPPNEEARLKIFEIHTRDKPLAEDVDLKKLAKKAVLPAGTEIIRGFILKNDLPFSGDAIRSICQEATQQALREFVAAHDAKQDYDQFKVCMKHFQEALEEIIPSVEASAQEDTPPREKKPVLKKKTPKGEEVKEITDKDLKNILN